MVIAAYLSAGWITVKERNATGFCGELEKALLLIFQTSICQLYIISRRKIQLHRNIVFSFREATCSVAVS